jgi:hypothetical protein
MIKILLKKLFLNKERIKQFLIQWRKSMRCPQQHYKTGYIKTFQHLNFKVRVVSNAYSRQIW